MFESLKKKTEPLKLQQSTFKSFEAYKKNDRNESNAVTVMIDQRSGYKSEQFRYVGGDKEGQRINAPSLMLIDYGDFLR